MRVTRATAAFPDRLRCSRCGRGPELGKALENQLASGTCSSRAMACTASRTVTRVVGSVSSRAVPKVSSKRLGPAGACSSLSWMGGEQVHLLARATGLRFRAGVLELLLFGEGGVEGE